MQVLITGDSHTATLKKGMELLVSKGDWPQQVDLTIRPLGNAKFLPTPFFVDKGNYAEICNPEYNRRFKRFPPQKMVKSDVIYGLSGPLHTARIRRHEAWSEFVPTQFVINETPISNALLDQSIRDDSRYLLEFIDVILRTQKNFFVIEPPRPFKHSVKSIRADVFNYVDNYYRDFIKQELKHRNVPIIAVDPECYDEAGFMLKSYENGNDPHHGNAEFGELMMKKILDFLLNSTQA